MCECRNSVEYSGLLTAQVPCYFLFLHDQVTNIHKEDLLMTERTGQVTINLQISKYRFISHLGDRVKGLFANRTQ